jgi:hypothetical protein
MSEAFRISPLKDEHLARMRAACAQNRQPKDPHGLPARTWAKMDLRVRSILVMLASSEMGDARETARKPWGSLSDADRQAIAALARTMRDETKDAACLF